MSMISSLNDLFEISKVNKNSPLFPPSLLIYNEGWLLRAIIQLWASSGEGRGFSFSCPKEAALFSEAQLKTPFCKETNTHADGIAGDFTIREGTKSGIDIKQDFKFLAVFEAKMYSGLAQKTTNIKNYTQVSRTIACMINEILRLKNLPDGSVSIHYVVLYPTDSELIIQPGQKYSKNVVRAEISSRLKDYKASGLNDFKKFNNEWEKILDLIKIEFKTWEEIIKQINQAELETFYDKCKLYSKKREIE